MTPPSATPRTDALVEWIHNDSRYKAPEQLEQTLKNHVYAVLDLCRQLERELADRATPKPAQDEAVAKLWLWKNFVGGVPEYWAFDNPFPVHMDGGDPQTLGEPCGYALFKPSRAGRTNVNEEDVLRRIEASAKPLGATLRCRKCGEHSDITFKYAVAHPPAPPVAEGMEPMPSEAESVDCSRLRQQGQMYYPEDYERLCSWAKQAAARIAAERNGWERECQDGDKIIAALGLERTEGGSLPIHKIMAALRELQSERAAREADRRVSVPVEPTAEVTGPLHVVCKCDKCAAAPPAEGKAGVRKAALTEAAELCRSMGPHEFEWAADRIEKLRDEGK